MWRKGWLLFSVIWAGIAALQAAVILGTSEEIEKALRPLLLGVAVPAALYLFGWVWERVRRK